MPNKKKNDENYIKFIAALPAIQSAIQISGQGDGAILKLEIPQSEIQSIVNLNRLAGEIFEVIIIPLDKRVINKSKIKYTKSE